MAAKRRSSVFELPREIAAKVAPEPAKVRAARPGRPSKAPVALPAPRVTPARVAAGVNLELSSEDATDLLSFVLEGRDAMAADEQRFMGLGQPERAAQCRARHARASRMMAALSAILVAQWEGRQ